MLRRSSAALDWSNLWLPAVVLGGGVALAAAAQIQPLIALALLVAVTVLTVAWPRRTQTLPRLFLYALAVLLIGYAVVGRGFAHLGVPPVYVGEIVLALGLVAALLGGGVRPAFRSRVVWLIVAFMAWGVWRTVPYLGKYGVVALRDGVTWGYAVFAILVSAFVLRTGWLPRIVRSYRHLVPLVLIGALAMIALDHFSGIRIVIPGSHAGLFDAKAGAIAVHLAGVGVFLTLGLHRVRNRGTDSVGSWMEWVWWGLWLGGFLMSGILNRGGMLAMVGALATVFVLRPSPRLAKVAFLGIMGLSALVVLDLRVDLQKRELSTEQIVANLQSIAGADDEKSLAGTRDWRLRWWNTILDYTVFGPYFWTGKGFGVNLSIDDGILLHESPDDPPTRSPHNGHLTVLARMGVPGLALWALLQATFGALMLKAYLRARRERRDDWARVNLWILAFWVAFLIHMNFSVFLEGPHGGIWFWSLLGFGIAALEIQKSLPRTAPRRAEPAVRATPLAPRRRSASASGS